MLEVGNIGVLFLLGGEPTLLCMRILANVCKDVNILLVSSPRFFLL